MPASINPIDSASSLPRRDIIICSSSVKFIISSSERNNELKFLPPQKATHYSTDEHRSRSQKKPSQLISVNVPRDTKRFIPHLLSTRKGSLPKKAKIKIGR